MQRNALNKQIGEKRKVGPSLCVWMAWSFLFSNALSQMLTAPGSMQLQHSTALNRQADARRS